MHDHNESTTSHDNDVQIVDWLALPTTLAEVARLRSQCQVTVSLAKRLRKRYGDPRTTALLSAAAGQRKAIEKWGVGDWLVTDRAIQQSTDRWIANYKAQRVPAAVEMMDWCCGVGGEAMHLIDRGPLTAIDCDPQVCAMARHNLNSKLAQASKHADPLGSHLWSVVCDDVFAHRPSSSVWLNLDPDRRTEHGRDARLSSTRATHCEYLNPPLSQWMPIAQCALGASIKLAPATELPEQYHAMGEREWISRGGTCRQQVIWLGGESQPGAIRSTVVAGDGSATSFCTSELQRCQRTTVCKAFVLDLDPAVRAAGLSESYAAAKGMKCLGGPAGFFTSDEHETDCLAQRFEVVWNGVADLKKIRQAVVQIGGRITEVKVRGLDWNPSAIMKQFGKNKGQQLTLLASRVDSYCGAILAIR